MASVIRGDDNFDSAGIVDGAAKAWVNFNGTGTVAIRSQYNVASITDNGTGNYTVNFTTAMSDTNYALCGLARSAYDNENYPSQVNRRVTSADTTSSISVYVTRNLGSDENDQPVDSSEVTLTVFR